MAAGAVGCRIWADSSITVANRIGEVSVSKLQAGRILAIILAGGVILQTGGCATTLAPLALSLAESIFLSTLTGGVFGGV